MVKMYSLLTGRPRYLHESLIAVAYRGGVTKLAAVFALLLLAVPASAARLPVLASHDWWPVFSPDSREVAFTNVDGQGRVFTLAVADSAKGDVTTLARASSQLDPSWSPDARSIAYQSGGRIWAVGIDGTGRRDVHPGLYPAWSPDGKTIAYVLGGVLHAGAMTFGTKVIGVPAWSPNGEQIAYAQSDGIYVSGKKVATPVREARTATWSPDGKTLAYVSGGTVYVVPADGASAPLKVAGPFRTVSPLAWSNTSDELSYTAEGSLVVTNADGGWHTLKPAKGAQGASYAPGAPHSDVLAYSGPNRFCAGHDAILLYGDRLLVGSCAITGTAAADVIDGTSAGGDRIYGSGGNDTIRAGNRHHDTVDCGAGRDTVYADKGDSLAHCEIVHR
jgi:Tol biopolymer transport system component